LCHSIIENWTGYSSATTKLYAVTEKERLSQTESLNGYGGEKKDASLAATAKIAGLLRVSEKGWSVSRLAREEIESVSSQPLWRNAVVPGRTVLCLRSCRIFVPEDHVVYP
jgi:hypothetical protein